MEQGSETSEALSGGASKVGNYSPTPYVDESWAVVKSETKTSQFSPLELQSVSVQASTTDSLFEDFTSLPLGPENAEVQDPLQTDSFIEATALLQKDVRAELLPEPELVSDSQVASAAPEILPAETPVLTLEAHERLLQAAREEAFLEAKQTVEADAEARVQELGAQLAAVAEDLKVQVAESLLSTEQKAAELALSVARKLIGAAVEGSADYLGPVLKEAIAAAGSVDIKCIRVSPRDYETLKGLKPEAVGAASDGSWAFEADESIHVGCIVVTANGEVDFDLDKAWGRIKRKILGEPGAVDE